MPYFCVKYFTNTFYLEEITNNALFSETIFFYLYHSHYCSISSSSFFSCFSHWMSVIVFQGFQWRIYQIRFFANMRLMKIQHCSEWISFLDHWSCFSAFITTRGRRDEWKVIFINVKLGRRPLIKSRNKNEQKKIVSFKQLFHR